MSHRNNQNIHLYNNELSYHVQLTVSYGAKFDVQSTFSFYSAGLIPSPEISLFTYPPHKSYNDYFDPWFTADVYPTFDFQQLEEQATVLCDGDKFCLYDVAVTGQLEAGNLTKMTSQRRMELIHLSRSSKTNKKKSP